MSTSDKLGDRMKMYESVPKTRLMKKVPVIVRIDGKAFHTFTSGFEKPFDDLLVQTMQYTTQYLCENIQGCVFGYTQSDEITLVLTDYKTYTTDAWFDYEVQKICSVAASMATAAFNKKFTELVQFNNNFITPEDEEHQKIAERHNSAMQKCAMFDARCFNVPIHEVVNCVLWRQQDAKRNSIQSVGQHHFPHYELQGLSCDDIIERLFINGYCNWNELPVHLKWGTAVYKNDEGNWVTDTNMPELREDKQFVEKHIYFTDN